MALILPGMFGTPERRHLEELLADYQRFCSRAYWEGVDAAARGIKKEQNPFPKNSAGAYFWLEGYSRSR